MIQITDLRKSVDLSTDTLTGLTRYVIEAWGRKPLTFYSARDAMQHLGALARQGFATEQAAKLLLEAAVADLRGIYYGAEGAQE